jgi:hypothetical protein
LTPPAPFTVAIAAFTAAALVLPLGARVPLKGKIANTDTGLLSPLFGSLDFLELLLQAATPMAMMLATATVNADLAVRFNGFPLADEAPRRLAEMATRPAYGRSRCDCGR